MQITTKNDVADIALQQSEDNKLEIINIYSKLKKLQTDIENNGNNQPEALPSIQYEKTLTYSKRQFQFTESGFCVRPAYLYSETNQNTTISVQAMCRYIGATASFAATILELELLVNDVVYATSTVTISNSTQYLKFDAISSPCTINEGTNTIVLKVKNMSNAINFRLSFITYTFDCDNAFFIEQNGNNLEIIYKDDNTYLFSCPYENNSEGYRYKEYDISATPNITDSGFTARTSNSFNNYKFNYLRTYNTETNKYEIATLSYGSYIFNNYLTIYLEEGGYKYSNTINYSLPCNHYAFAPSYDASTLFKCMFITGANVPYYVNFDATKINNFPTQITDFYQPENVLTMFAAKPIDDTFNSNRQFSVITTYKDSTTYLHYFVNDQLKSINLGKGFNATAYFYEDSLLVFLRQKNKLNMFTFDFVNGEYVLNNIKYIGSFNQIFLASKDVWFAKTSKNSLVKIPSQL